jgi:hypothetical protein
MEKAEIRLEIAKITIAVCGFLVAASGAYAAYVDYSRKAELQAADHKRKAELQTLRALHEAQLRTCETIAHVSASLFSASSQSEFNQALMEFARVKHGKALAIADKPVLDGMVQVYNAAAQINSPQLRGDQFEELVRAKLCNRPFEVVLKCRQVIVDGFAREGGNIQSIDSDYPMKWTPSSCPGSKKASAAAAAATK